MITILRLGCLDEAISDLERLEEAGLCPPSRIHLLLNKLVTNLISNDNGNGNGKGNGNCVGIGDGNSYSNDNSNSNGTVKDI